MARKNERDTKGKIVSAAWKLFYEQGYDDTTIEEIIEASGTSRGTFYHYFEGKDSLLSSLSYLFDDKYTELQDRLDPQLSATEQLTFLNYELFAMIENSVSIELLAMLYSSQLTTRGDKHLLDSNRFYYRVLRKIISAGLANGEFNESYTVNDIIKAYAMFERSFLYDWCLCNGDYSLKEYSQKMLPKYMSVFKK